MSDTSDFHKNASFRAGMLNYLNTTFAFGKQTNENFINRKVRYRPTYLLIKKIPLDFDMNISINNHIISKVDNLKYLGVVLDNKLTWNSHIAQVKNIYPKPVELLQGLDITFPSIL